MGTGDLESGQSLSSLKFSNLGQELQKKNITTRRNHRSQKRRWVKEFTQDHTVLGSAGVG